MTRPDARPGTYALILPSSVRRRVEIGKLGRLDVESGFYVYIGSAFGPGGLAARLSRHCRKSKTLRWHIDYLTAAIHVGEIWYTFDTVRRECQWAGVFDRIHGTEMPLAAFGSSDCACEAHLWRLSERPSYGTFRRKLARSLPDHGRVYRLTESASGGL